MCNIKNCEIKYYKLQGTYYNDMCNILLYISLIDSYLDKSIYNKSYQKIIFLNYGF